MVKIPAGRKDPKAFPPDWAGAVQLVSLESRVLEGNPLGDPSQRDVAVYLPPSGQTEGLPLVVHLPGFTGAGWSEIQRERYASESLFRIFDRLVRSHQCGEAVLIAPDCLTAMGGSQYVNSEATGRYEDYVADEVIPWARERFRTGRTGILGQSSGGFGSLHLVMSRARLADAVGSSAGDMAFEYCYLSDFPKAFRTCLAAGGAEAFLEQFFGARTSFKGPLEPVAMTINALAMAACYSPRKSEPGAFDLPFDPVSGELEPEVWSRWLSFDPIRRLHDPEVLARLRALRSIHVTASRQDEYALDVGARIFAKHAAGLRLPVTHEEFDGGHGDRGPRYETLYARMVGALTDGQAR